MEQTAKISRFHCLFSNYLAIFVRNSKKIVRNIPKILGKYKELFLLLMGVYDTIKEVT
ncbi:hypothetical protein [Clostridium sp. HBUAS56010]|uniref:hypothetical protein n=1 Tax=Clostridium sp. HBUAS56010 TaxID=2571127 RepID=UPI00163DC4A4|nr:hypothetical protein [Clostridium sp. HBUAS56010]